MSLGPLLAVLFTTPAAAAATAAAVAAVPIAIHLFNRRRFRVVDWAAMRFLQAAVRRTNRRLRFEQWLLLAARTLLALAPILAMIAATTWAEPLWRRLFPAAVGGPAFAGRTYHVVIIDGSMSMGRRRDDGTAFEKARTAAGRWVGAAQGGDAFSVILMAAPPRVVVPGPANDRGRVAREIADLRATDGAADLAQTLQFADDALSRGPTGYDRRLVTIFTDLQRSQWTTPPGSAGAWVDPWQRLHARADVALVDVGDESRSNLAVTGLSIDDPAPTVGARPALTAVVHNFGQAEERRIPVELRETAPGQPPRVVRQELIDIPPGASATVAFALESRSAGEYRYDVALPADPLIADNTRSLSVFVRAALPTLLVDGRPGDGYASATGWLAAALNPFDDPAAPATPARPRVIDAVRLTDPTIALNDFDCVWYCDVARPTARDRERLESYVSRGGTLVIGLGPQCDPEAYRRAFGEGEFLPVRLAGRQRAADDKPFHPAGTDDAFRRPPLAAFAADDDRASLTSARIAEYWRVEPTGTRAVRRLMGLAGGAPSTDGLLYEWAVGRGRVLLFTTTFAAEWTSWPVSPSYPAFIQELLRYAARSAPRRDLIVGETLEEPLGETTTASEGSVRTPDGRTATVAIATDGDEPRLRWTETEVSGRYVVRVPGRADAVFHANPPVGEESDLSRATAADLPATGQDFAAQIVADPSAARRTVVEPTRPSAAPATGELGSAVARWPLLLALALLVAEPILAWRFGSARGPAAAIDRPAESVQRLTRHRLLGALAMLPLIVVTAVALVLIHAVVTGTPFGFLPDPARVWIEQRLGVPAAVAGEGTRWRFDRSPAFSGDAATERWLIALAAGGIFALSAWIYSRELRGASLAAALPPVALRLGLAVLTLFVLLPQLRLVFEREGWPDLVLIVDDSKSMGVAETEGGPDRLAVARRFLAADGRNWLERLSTGKQARLHVYRAGERLIRVGAIEGPGNIGDIGAAVAGLQPVAPQSRLGESVRGVLQEFRGSALGGIVLLTDGVTTDGEDLVAAGRHAGRAGVPLWIVGIGDAREPADLELSDLKIDDVVRVGDRLVFEARLTARGVPAASVPVILSEREGDTLTELARVIVSAEPGAGPARVRLTHTPTQPGDRTYVVSVAAHPGEADTENNRITRTIRVDEFKRTRVLFIEGRPRYDFRFVKTLFEREAEKTPGSRSVELKVLLAEADPDFSRQDRSALEAFPASRDELFNRFDAVILGDVTPDHPLLGDKRLQWLAEFVKEKGGGLLLLAGPQAMPHAYRGTPLAAVLPADGARPGGVSHPAGYRPALTAAGRGHSAFRFDPDDAESAAVWERLKPQYWSVGGLTPRAGAEVLAFIPGDSGDRSGEPVALQQFVGAGRVMLLGFAESWRWRWREDEPRFNQFWTQLVRHVARTRPSRPQIRLDRQTAYRRGEPIRVTAQFPDDQPPPGGDAGVRVTLERTGAARQTLTLAPVAGARAVYETLVTRTPEGDYEFTLSGVDGRASTVRARVLPPPGEMDRLQINRSDMERAAQLSRGRYYPAAEADRLPDDLPPPPRVTLHQPRPPWPIWNTPAVVLLGIALAAGEWLLRKRLQLL